MLRWLKNRFRDHFGVSRAEANGMLVLLLVSLIFLLIPPGLKWYYSRQPLASHDADIALLEDMLKQLETQRKSTKSRSAKPAQRKHCSPKFQRFDINTVNVTQLRTIKGIGEVLSARIVKFRDKLGGFVNPDQYEEVYGLRPEVVQRLKKQAYISPNFLPQRLNINAADIRTLVAHPYLTYPQARAIVRYREQYGSFSNVAALDAIVLIDEATLYRVKPYLIAH